MMENPIEMDDLGYPYFWKHPYVTDYNIFPRKNTRLKIAPQRRSMILGQFLPGVVCAERWPGSKMLLLNGFFLPKKGVASPKMEIKHVNSQKVCTQFLS